MAGYTRQQWLTLLVFSVSSFFSAACISVMAPFYPHEAESKGATPTQYGLVFGISQLVTFIVSPLYGAYMKQIGPRFLLITGVLVSAFTTIIFGYLHYITDANLFIGFSFVVRIIGALGTAAIPSVSFSYVAMEFSGNTGSAFACLETAFGLGLVIGPAVGGVLYEFGGFTLPFLVLGCALICSSCISCMLLPPLSSDSDYGTDDLSILDVVRIPSVLLYIYTIFVCAFSIGWYESILEPHLRPFDLKPSYLGLIFIFEGIAYSITTPFWGRLIDKSITPRSATIICGLIGMVSFVFLGPAPFFNISTSVPLCISSLILCGVALGGLLVGSFNGMIKDIFRNGFPDDLSVYAIISGIFNSSFAFGMFAGASCSGIMMDTIGFDWGAVVVSVLYLIAVLLHGGYELYFYVGRFSRKEYTLMEYIRITENNGADGDFGKQKASYGTIHPNYSDLEDILIHPNHSDLEESFKSQVYNGFCLKSIDTNY